jgi:translation initiation factor IF-2
MLSPEKVEEVLGEVEVRQTFRASRIGTIAGCMVTQGTVTRGAQVRIVRDGTIVHDGRIGTLKRFQDDVREVAQGFECGLTVDGYNDIKEGDVLEVYAVREVARSA